MVTGFRGVNWSCAEITALAAKAARGAGAAPGQAMRFGAVAVVHLLAGRHASDLADALAACPEGAVRDYPARLDQALACIAQGTETDIFLRRDALLDSYVDALVFAAHLEAVPEGGWRLRGDLSRPLVKANSGRIELDPALMAQFEQLAARTYVPETDASRLRGAGAGVSDND